MSTPPQPGDAERLAEIRARSSEAWNEGQVSIQLTVARLDRIDLLRLLDAAQSALAEVTESREGMAQLQQSGDAERLESLRKYYEAKPVAGFTGENERFLLRQLDAAQSALAESQKDAASYMDQRHRLAAECEHRGSALAASQAEVARLKDEVRDMLAEFRAAARAQGELEGMKEATIAWSVCASIHRKYAKGKDALYTTRQADFVKHEDDCRARVIAALEPKE